MNSWNNNFSYSWNPQYNYYAYKKPVIKKYILIQNLDTNPVVICTTHKYDYAKEIMSKIDNVKIVEYTENT